MASQAILKQLILSIKTGTVTGKGYFVNTTGGAVTVNLPAGNAGGIVGFKDYAGTWDTNAMLQLNPNGSDKIRWR